MSWYVHAAGEAETRMTDAELLERLTELLERVTAALTEARQLIKSYRGLPGWAEYQRSAEMQRINGALDAAYRTPRVRAVV